MALCVWKSSGNVEIRGKRGVFRSGFFVVLIGFLCMFFLCEIRLLIMSGCMIVLGKIKFDLICEIDLSLYIIFVLIRMNNFYCQT